LGRHEGDWVNMTNAEYEAQFRDEPRFVSQEAAERAYFKLYAEWQARGWEIDRLARRVHRLRQVVKKYKKVYPQSEGFYAKRFWWR
jgi:hypothetical protein